MIGGKKIEQRGPPNVLPVGQQKKPSTAVSEWQSEDHHTEIKRCTPLAGVLGITCQELDIPDLLGPIERKLREGFGLDGVPTLVAFSILSTQLNTRPCCRFASASKAGPYTKQYSN